MEFLYFIYKSVKYKYLFLAQKFPNAPPSQISGYATVPHMQNGLAFLCSHYKLLWRSITGVPMYFNPCDPTAPVVYVCRVCRREAREDDDQVFQFHPI